MKKKGKKNGKKPKKLEEKKIKIAKLPKNETITQEIQQIQGKNIPISEENNKIVLNQDIQDISKLLEEPKPIEKLIDFPDNMIQNDDINLFSKEKISEFNLYDDPSIYLRRTLRDRKKITLKDAGNESLIHM